MDDHDGAAASAPGHSHHSGSASQHSRLKGFSTVSLLTLLSRITGLARDALMASVFGTGMLLDGFSLAFRLPNLARRLLGDGAMAAAFLPEFVREERELGRTEATRLLDSVAGRLSRILLQIIVPAEIVLAMLRFGMELPERVSVVVELTAIMLPFMLMVCLTALLGAALNSIGKFRVAAFTPVLLNLVWLAAGLALATTTASLIWQIRLIAAAIVAGGTLQLIVSIVAVRHAGLPLRWPAFQSVDDDLRRRRHRVFAVILPALTGLSITQLNALVDSGLAWGLSRPEAAQVNVVEPERTAIPGQTSTIVLPPPEITTAAASEQSDAAQSSDQASDTPWGLFADGTASALYLGQRLFQFPMGVFGIALGTVLFPRFARHVAAGSRTEFAGDVDYGLRLVILIGIPASVGLWMLAEPIARLLFQRGRFDEEAVQLTAQMIAIHGAGVWIFCALLMTNRAFYADSDQQTPIRQGIICVVLNLLLDVALIPVFHELALPWATNLATLGQLCLALLVLHWRQLLSDPGKLTMVFVRSVVASTVMFLAGHWIMQSLPAESSSTLSRLLVVVTPICTSVVVYFSVLWLLRFRLTELTGART
ncbi:MAG: murein biosynthesis integral membrane protein MurJ [Planctomycetaceae bacterium]|nr:murein biosynthesis integral membrane protein MurJ [Planctomycetaceae bacterium]